MTDAAVLVAHGSRLAEPCRAFVALATRLDARLPGLRVLPAFLEFGSPDVPAVISAVVAEGAEVVTVLPFFLHSGAHVRRDLPELVAAARSAHPGVEVSLAACLEGEPGLEDLLAARLRGCAAEG